MCVCGCMCVRVYAHVHVCVYISNDNVLGFKVWPSYTCPVPCGKTFAEYKYPKKTRKKKTFLFVKY